MDYQKTYHGQSANQILKDATISVMSTGNVAITHPNFPDCIFMQDQDGDLVIDSYEGVVVCIMCGKKAAEKLQSLKDDAETKQYEILKAEDLANGTTYAEII